MLVLLLSISCHHNPNQYYVQFEDCGLCQKKNQFFRRNKKVQNKKGQIRDIRYVYVYKLSIRELFFSLYQR